VRWLLLGSCLVAFLAALACGHWVGKKGEKPTVALASVGLIVLGLRLALPPAMEFALFSGDLYPVLRPWWPIPTSLALLAAGANHMSTEGSKRGIRLFAGLLVVSASLPLFQTARFDASDFEGSVGPDGVCLQSSDYTCGAAAAATLLATYGVSADEAEMAERCWTNSMTGTDEFCVARGLRQKLEGTGREVQLISSDWEALVARGQRPAMATIRYSTFVDHWVVIFGTEGDSVLVGDPLVGRRRIGKKKFLELWRKSLVTADLPGAPQQRPSPEGTAALSSAQ
jgi:peptidase C39-like protein